ncbi:MAG TPA: hypothetical protein VJN89_18400 [Candidatus Acidoferrum sp.]|nr:hypothetical protein [Candidatus Acidoferrum sp.]
MLRSARFTSSSEESVASFPAISNTECRVEGPIAPAANAFTAFSFEFVAKPEQAVDATLLLPAAIQSGLEDIAGFAGSLVMVSDHEARLITVIIFWSGTEARRNCERSVRRVRALLAPYMDRCLRAQNMLAHLPASQDTYPQTGSIDNCYMGEESVAQEANVCAA